MTRTSSKSLPRRWAAGVALAVVACGLLCGGAPALAQAGPNRAVWRFQGGLSSERIIAIVKRVERQSNDLRRNFERSMRRGRVNGVRAGEAKTRLQRMDERIEKLRRAAVTTVTVTSLRNELSDALEAARALQAELATERNLRLAVGNRWRAIRIDLNRLAALYRLRGLG